jgi:hypothetical protein
MSEWAKFPMEALTDERLTLRHCKIIVAMNFYSYKNHKPSRAELAEKTNIPINHISRATRDLCEFGWLLKNGDGGKNMRCDYKLLNPMQKIGTDSVPLIIESKSIESTKSVRAEGSKSVPLKAPSQCGAVIRNKKKQNKQDARAHLAELGVSENIIEDFIELRKIKHAPITGTAIEGIQREALKANCSFAEAVRTCCERGWVGFKAEWVLSKGGGYQTKQQNRPWFMSATGIRKKGEELGIQMNEGEHFQDFKARIYIAENITDEIVKKEKIKEFA